MLDNCYGQHGWKEFYRNRKNILAEFDKIREQTENRPVQVAHGQAVEAYIRKWFAEFLPKKYGITSGYIIPNLYTDSEKIYHYDIIIYDSLNSPVLWTEGNEDQSEQGKYRAIPAKYVVAIYEIKSRLTKPNVTEALDKLDQTRDFSDQLNILFSCGTIFIELKESENNRKSILKELLKGKDIFGFSGGMVLRYEGDVTCTGLINLFNAESNKHDENKQSLPLAKPIDDLNIYMTEAGNLQIAEQGGGTKLMATSENTWSVSKLYSAMYKEESILVDLSWSRTNFSDFCIKLLSSLEGIALNDIEQKPSFGRIFDSVERKKAPLQDSDPQKDKPFLILKLYEGGDYGEKLAIDYDTSEPTIRFSVVVENKGDTGAILSDDSFKNQCELSSGKTAIKQVTLQAQTQDNTKSFKEILESEPFQFQYRLVYYPINNEKEFYAIEKDVKLTSTDIEFL